jgi:hypothetical protein
MSAIEATTAGFKDMADGTLRLYFDVEPRNAGAALELFRERGRAAALAALLHSHELAKPQEWPALEPEKPKGGERAKWLGIRCNEEQFQRWICAQFPDVPIYGVINSEKAADIVRKVIDVESRAEIDNNPISRSRFDNMIRKPYMESQR